MVVARLGSPWREEMHAYRDSVLLQRALTAEERVSRPSVAAWYAGRSVFVTGASGFMGRVLVEFLLRCCPDIGRVYVVLRAKKGVPAQERLPVLFDVPLFDRLRREQPNALSKVVALSGDVEALSLGLSDEDRARLRAEVSVVFHVAASVRFDDPFRKAVFTNLRSAREVVALARDMPQLKVLVHVSTAYCYINQNPVEERVYPGHLDWRQAIRWAEELPDVDQMAVDFLGDKVRGFQPNTYTLTKAMAERLMEEAAEELPVVITRPSIVVGSLSDPMPGWMDNLNGLCGFWAGSFKGLLRVLKNRDAILDTVPVDVCTKLILLASWAKGLGLRLSTDDVAPSSTQTEGKPDRRAVDSVDVVNVTVGTMLGVSLGEFQFVTELDALRRRVPFPGTLRVPHFRLQPCPFLYALTAFYHHILFGLVLDLLARVAGVKPRLMSIYRRVSVALHATARFRVQCDFAMEHQHRLQVLMHPDDVAALDFLDAYLVRDTVESYLATVVENLRGIMLYVLREEDDVERNLRGMDRVKWLMRVYHTAMAILAASLAFGLYSLLWRRSAEVTTNLPTSLPLFV